MPARVCIIVVYECPNVPFHIWTLIPIPLSLPMIKRTIIDGGRVCQALGAVNMICICTKLARTPPLNVMTSLAMTSLAATATVFTKKKSKIQAVKSL